MSSLWDSLEELEAAVVDYQANWWRTNIDARRLLGDAAAFPGLRGEVASAASTSGIVTTAEIYKSHPESTRTGGHGYLPGREELHAKIVDACIPVQLATPREPPTAFFTIGCPGAGKTTILRKIVETYRESRGDQHEALGYSLVDADKVRQLLPEYANGLGSLVVATECYDLTYGPIFDAALIRRGDLVYDTIGVLASIRENVELLSSNGFEIHILEARATEALCKERTARRALQTDGRLVNPAMLHRWTSEAAETIPALRAEGFPLSGWAVIDTTTADQPTLLDGTSPWRELLS